MEVISLLVSEGGSIKAISSADLLPAHRLIAAYVRGPDGPVLASHVEEGPIKLETSIGVKWFDHSVDKTVVQFDLFHATNESRVSYPANLIGRHKLDESAIARYKDEAMRRLEAAARKQAPKLGEGLSDDDIRRLMPSYKFVLDRLMRVRYVKEKAYMSWVDDMVSRITDRLRNRDKRSMTLIIEEDANSAGNLIALACWERIKGFVRAVVVCNESGFTKRSKKVASRYPPRYITFFDAVFDTEVVKTRARFLEEAERQFNQNRDDFEADREEYFSVIFAAPCSIAAGATEFPIREIFPENVRGSVFFATGEYLSYSRHTTESLETKLVIQLLGRHPGADPFYTDRFISHPDRPLKFLTGYMGLLHPDKGSNGYTESTPLVENYEIDRDFMHFADSIDYRFFAWTASGEPRMQSVTDMSTVLSPKRPV